MKRRNVSGRFSLQHRDSDAYAPPLPGLPIVEIVGDGRLLVENHNGVIAYSENTICVRVKYGELRISGACLSLSYMSKCQLVITGSVDAVCIERR